MMKVAGRRARALVPRDFSRHPGALVLAVLVSLASAATSMAQSLQVFSDKDVYEVGETIFLTVLGDPQGESDENSAIFGKLLYDAALTETVSSSQEPMNSFAGMWTTSASLETGDGFAAVFDQIGPFFGSPSPADCCLHAEATLVAEAPGIVTVEWKVSPGEFDTLDFFQVTDFGSFEGTTFEIVEPAISCGTDSDCDDGNVCTDDVCTDGQCTHTNNTAPCEDGNACTESDVCGGGSCGGTTITCDDGNACTTEGCNPSTGQCETTSEVTCGSGGACDAGEVCNPDTGQCEAGPPVDCDDGLACTQDMCAEPDGCMNVPIDSDGDGVDDCNDGCIDDPNKTDPGQCGCGNDDVDSDSDGVADCVDDCPNDPAKLGPGVCGCGTPDEDSDGDMTPDCNDGCIDDPNKTDPGQCGCGIEDTDTDGDGIADCEDRCVLDEDNDADGDGVCGDIDNCPDETNVGQADFDRDGVGDDCDNCKCVANPDQEDRDADEVGDLCDLLPMVHVNECISAQDPAALLNPFIAQQHEVRCGTAAPLPPQVCF